MLLKSSQINLVYFNVLRLNFKKKSAGFAVQYLDLLNPLIKLLPADYHWWLCNIIFVEALLCLFQTPVNCLFAKFYGLCPSSLQIVGAVVLPSIGAFYLKPFQGYTFLLFALGWFTGLLSTVKGSTQLRVNKWIGITATILIAKVLFILILYVFYQFYSKILPILT